MACYFIAEITVTDKSWVRKYIEDVSAMVERHGGRYLARTPKVERLEGERKPPHTAAIIEFPTREAALAFFRSEEYAPYRAARVAGSASEVTLVEGEDSVRRPA